MAKNEMTERDWWQGLMGMTKEEYQQKQWAKGKDALGVPPPKTFQYQEPPTYAPQKSAINKYPGKASSSPRATAGMQPSNAGTQPALQKAPMLTEKEKNKKIIDDWLRESKEQGPLSSDDLFRMNAEQQIKIRNRNLAKNMPVTTQEKVQPYPYAVLSPEEQYKKAMEDWMKTMEPFGGEYLQGLGTLGPNITLPKETTNDTLIKNDLPATNRNITDFLVEDDPFRVGHESVPLPPGVHTYEEWRKGVASHFDNTLIFAPGTSFSEEVQAEIDATDKGLNFLDNLMNYTVDSYTPFKTTYQNDSLYQKIKLPYSSEQDERERLHNMLKAAPKTVGNLIELVKLKYGIKGIDPQFTQQTVGAVLGALDPTFPDAPTMLEHLIPIPDVPISKREHELSRLHDFYRAYPQYRYLIEDPKSREKFVELLQKQAEDIELSQDYTPLEKQKITTMLWHVIQLNQNAERELAYARQRVQEYAIGAK